MIQHDVILLKNPHEPIVIKWLVASHFFCEQKDYRRNQRMPEGLPHLLALSIDGSAETINLTDQLDWTVGNKNHPPGFPKKRTPETAKNCGRVPWHHGKYVRERAPFTNKFVNKFQGLTTLEIRFWCLVSCFFFPFGSFTTILLKGTPIWFEIEKVQKRKKSIFTKKVES